MSRISKLECGTNEDTDFCSPEAACRGPPRFVAIEVAGRVGTQLLGYDNRLASAYLDRLQLGEEPPWSSDEWWVRDAGATTDEVDPRQPYLPRHLRHIRSL